MTSASRDADQNRSSYHQDAVNRVEFACRDSEIHCEHCDAERQSAKLLITDFMKVILV
jgi:hypothetical protein